MWTVTRTPNTIPKREAVQMSLDELAKWGAETTLYVRPLDTDRGRRLGVFAGDGSFLGAVETMGEVFAAAEAQSMELTTVH